MKKVTRDEPHIVHFQHMENSPSGFFFFKLNFIKLGDISITVCQYHLTTQNLEATPIELVIVTISLPFLWGVYRGTQLLILIMFFFFVSFSSHVTLKTQLIPNGIPLLQLTGAQAHTHTHTHTAFYPSWELSALCYDKNTKMCMNLSSTWAGNRMLKSTHANCRSSNAVGGCRKEVG